MSVTEMTDPTAAAPPPARILVVDDEPDMEVLIRQRFRRKIKAGEFDFLFAENGRAALEVIDRNAVDLVLSDINMPEMDGLTLLDQLRSLKQELRTVIVSAYGDMDNIRTAMNRGAFDFLTKPIQFDDLERTIGKTVEAVREMQALRDAKEEAERTRAAMARYFSPNIARQLLENPEALFHRGERRTVSFMFTDLQGFTPLIEKLDPDLIIPLLNAYLETITEIVFRHEGTVVKVVGDAVQAMFNAPIDQPDHADRAIACALEIDAAAEAFRAARAAEGIELGPTRIGLNTGPAVVGNFGGEAYFDYTAHGDAVNAAARLEGVNKFLGTRVCVAAATAEAAKDFVGRPVGDLVLKGKHEAIRAFEPLAPGAADADRLAAYEAAFALMDAGDEGAVEAFEALLAAQGDDGLVATHLERLRAGATGARMAFDAK